MRNRIIEFLIILHKKKMEDFRRDIEKIKIYLLIARKNTILKNINDLRKRTMNKNEIIMLKWVKEYTTSMLKINGTIIASRKYKKCFMFLDFFNNWAGISLNLFKDINDAEYWNKYNKIVVDMKDKNPITAGLNISNGNFEFNADR